ncbi:MAG: TIGR04255 family protein [Mycobacterium sp.]|nr:TIGR04255 family protein [Mycobacterium sp.]
MGETGPFDDLPSFDRPPVVEVAVGVHFLQLPGLNTVSLVRLVDDLWRDRFPRTIEQPLSPPLSPPGRGPMLAFQLKAGSPPIRLWSLTEDQSTLIQVQHDRLLLNWRKVKDDDPYPRYKRLRGDFAEVWQEFSTYVDYRDDYGVLQPSVAEVSFFNRVPMEGATQIPTFVNALNPHWKLTGQLAAAYQLEREIADGPVVGNQNIALNFRPENGHMQLEISTRIEIDTATGEASEVMNSLDAAHRTGVLTFDSVTTENAHSAWGRHDAGNG